MLIFKNLRRSTNTNCISRHLQSVVQRECGARRHRWNTVCPQPRTNIVWHAGGVYGDGDPVDVVEVSSAQLNMGGMYQVKCVGVYAMIDDGELDWKVIAINAADPLADKINDVEDVERCRPPRLPLLMC